MPVDDIFLDAFARFGGQFTQPVVALHVGRDARLLAGLRARGLTIFPAADAPATLPDGGGVCLLVDADATRDCEPSTIEQVANLAQPGVACVILLYPLGDAETLAHLAAAEIPAQWAQMLALRGFWPDLGCTIASGALQSRCFRPGVAAPPQMAGHYENRLWWLEAQNRLQSQKIGQIEQNLVSQSEELAETQKQLRRQTQKVQWLQAAIREIKESQSWRMIRVLQRIREFLIPPGSRRERLAHLMWRGLRAWRRDGTLATFRRGLALLQQLLYMWRYRWFYRRRAKKLFWAAEPVQLQASSLPEPRTRSVDVIVCVHNAYEDVKRCLESVVRYSSPPYQLILVDDGSQPQTGDYLRQFAADQGALLLRNEAARGYTFAANQGLRAATADYALLLNSDTVVTPGWLDGMVACGESDAQIGVVGPLSNTASWQSVPETLNEQGDWADNLLPEGVSINEMAARLQRASERLYPRLPFLNGFCLMIKRAVLDEVGYFDEEAFGAGYGEENDFCIRSVKAGWQLAVADDVYIFHAQSKSYSHERRQQLARRADLVLANKHGQPIISSGLKICKEDPVLLGIRARATAADERARLVQRALRQWEGRRILVLLPVLGATGGGHVIVQEAKAMRKMGVDVHILNYRTHQASFAQAHPESDLYQVYVEEPRLEPRLLKTYDAIIATVYHTVKWLDPILPQAGRPIRGYYIQDYEPWFFEEGSADYEEARSSYTRFGDLVRVTKTAWNRNVLRENLGIDAHVIGPSLDIDIFRPRPPADPPYPARPLRIAAMVRPSTPRRQPELTVEVLREFHRRHKGEVEIIIFGCHPSDPQFQRMVRGLSFRHAGLLNRPQLARLFNEADIFLDASSFQAMGLTAMEAMACGSAVIVPKEGGADSFARHEHNALFVDTSSQPAVLHQLERLFGDHALRQRLQHQAIQDLCAHSPEKAAYHLLDALFGGQPQVEKN